MEGISYITDNYNRKKAVVIDLKTIEEHEDDVHDFIDALIAESRKDDEMIDWEKAKEDLKSTGKL
ncbi:hypothetical protein [Mucilaginibacter sp.]|jgi:hypothetical protein|uniref:hypothetical protein n=1 Tax=Mucilaginibacter sp. TaxID=1882438 RepID=UPI002B553A6B|nr:hypothetical protein [Mucilaginibacter sp.]HTI61002.1 hypothetical protein [Mucilaginibacter sp.]